MKAKMNKSPLWQKFATQNGRSLLPNALVVDRIIEALPRGIGSSLIT